MRQRCTGLSGIAEVYHKIFLPGHKLFFFHRECTFKLFSPVFGVWKVCCQKISFTFVLRSLQYAYGQSTDYYSVADEQDSDCYVWFSCRKLLSQVEAKRHAMQTSVLALLAGHTPKFKEYLFKDNIKLLDFLVKMLNSVKNAGLRHSICKALSALVLEVHIYDF